MGFHKGFQERPFIGTEVNFSSMELTSLFPQTCHVYLFG